MKDVVEKQGELGDLIHLGQLGWRGGGGYWILVDIVQIL